jgi:hypothetical protein
MEDATMKSRWNVVTPSLLICAAFPILFLLAPDGIPCVYAGCGAAADGSVTELGVTQCRGCSANDAQDENIALQNCSVSKTLSKCEITATVDVSIKGQCSVGWYNWCFSDIAPQCSNALALNGPNWPNFTRISTTHGCTADQELMSIHLLPSRGEWGQTCECEPLGSQGQFDWTVYIGSGTCNLP